MYDADKNLQPTIAATLTQQISADVGRFLIKTGVKVSAWVKQIVLKVLSDEWDESNYLVLVKKMNILSWQQRTL